MIALGFEEAPRFADCPITILNISQSPIDLTVSIKVLILLIAHLSYAVMRAVLRFRIPASILFVYQLIEALKLNIINDP